jgi:hypothetical protein
MDTLAASPNMLTSPLADRLLMASSKVPGGSQPADSSNKVQVNIRLSPDVHEFLKWLGMYWRTSQGRAVEYALMRVWSQMSGEAPRGLPPLPDAPDMPRMGDEEDEQPPPGFKRRKR